MITDHTTALELLGICADITQWSQDAGLPGDYGALWRKHDALLRRIHAPASGRGPTAADRLRQMELEVWIEILRRSLLSDASDRVASAFMSNGGSTLWTELGPERRDQVMRGRQVHARSAERSFLSALRQFCRSPSCRRVAEALRALDDLVDSGSPPSEGWTSEQLSLGVEWLTDAVLRVVPPVAREILASEVEETFSLRFDPTWLDELGTSPAKRRSEPAWAPSWERLGSSYERAEPAAPWFTPEIQDRYEERRHARELEQAHADAEAENRRRMNEIAEERRRREEEVRAAEEHERRELTARRAKEERERVLERVREEARQVVIGEAAAAGTTLKGIPEPQRSWRINDVAEEILRRYDGQKQTRMDTK